MNRQFILALCFLCFPLRLTHGKTPSLLLMGEVHDNPTGHQQRLDKVTALIQGGWRPALLMEQLDREVQPALEKAQKICKDVDCLLSKVPYSQRWNWDFYKPFLKLALDYQLPLVAANVSREEAKKVVDQGLEAVLDKATIKQLGLKQKKNLLSAQAKEIKESHCNALPPNMVDSMVLAQIARDVWMAKELKRFAPKGAVLLAGNGHVRKDIGVPVWLGGLPYESIAYVEGAEPKNAFHEVHKVPPHPRPDPCFGIAPFKAKSQEPK